MIVFHAIRRFLPLTIASRGTPAKPRFKSGSCIGAVLTAAGASRAARVLYARTYAGNGRINRSCPRTPITAVFRTRSQFVAARSQNVPPSDLNWPTLETHGRKRCHRRAHICKCTVAKCGTHRRDVARRKDFVCRCPLGPQDKPALKRTKQFHLALHLQGCVALTLVC